MLLRVSLTVLTALITGALWAAPPLTTVRDTIYRADGSRFAGQIIIEWRSFEASDSSFIGRQRLQLDIVDGALNVRLVPTTTAVTPAYYVVKYVTGGNIQFQEAWAVKPSTDVVHIRDVRIADPLLGPSVPAGGTGGGGGTSSGPANVTIADVDGLQAELDIRPRKGTGFAPGAAAVINASGDLDAASGSPSDCIHVDGSSGPCGSGSSTSAVFGTFVDGETPNGSVNGSNSVFTLSQTPNPASSLLLYRNGMLQKQALDYSLANQTITFVAGAIPQPGDVVIASYRTAGSGGTLPQVLCTGVGSSTSSSASVTLGACTIPASLLRSGDRVEIQFDYSHQGSLTNFNYLVHWGSSTLSNRTVAAATSALSARSSVGIYSGGAQFSNQIWGTNLAMITEIGASSESLASPITIDFQGSMASATTDSVTLRNFTVVRYPAP